MSPSAQSCTAGLACLLFAGCVTLPASRTLADASIYKTNESHSTRTRFSKAEFREILAALRPLFEQSGFRCSDDGSEGGFSIVEGPVHYASYQLLRTRETSLHCLIKATWKGLRLEIDEYEGKHRTKIFTTTATGTAAIVELIQRIESLLRSRYPHVQLEVKSLVTTTGARHTTPTASVIVLGGSNNQ
jgi:hypothetical protein